MRWPHVDPWLVAVVALAAALLGLGAWVIVDQTTSETQAAAKPVHGLASADVVRVLTAQLAAANRRDREALVGFYTRDSVYEERDLTPALVLKGNEQIADRYLSLGRFTGMHLRQESPIIQFGRYAARMVGVAEYRSSGGAVVYELDQNGKITHQWILGGSP